MKGCRIATVFFYYDMQQKFVRGHNVYSQRGNIELFAVEILLVKLDGIKYPSPRITARL